MKFKSSGTIWGLEWNRRYLLRSYLRSSLWAIPIMAVVLQQIFTALIHAMDARIGWAELGLGMEGAKAMFNTVITFSLSIIVFTFGSLLVAIQVANDRYTPRTRQSSTTSRDRTWT